MIAVRSHEMKNIDKYAIEQLGIPGIVLMENAAKSFVEAIIKDERIFHDSITIVCGTGNNGGDGFAIARMLKQRNITVNVVVIGKIDHIKGDAAINYDLLKQLDIKVVNLTNESEKEQLNILDTSIIIDAIFGTGCLRPLEGIYEKVVRHINHNNAKVYSVDVPTGVNSDNGKIMNVAINAHKTITFCLPKVGLFLYPGALLTGEVLVTDIGIPEKVILNNQYDYEIIDEGYKSLIPKRKIVSHKGTYGKVLIIAGSKNMMGAAMLAAYAAYRTGCGLVKVLTEKGNEHVLYNYIPEAIIETYVREEDAFLQCLDAVNEAVEWADAILIGPGMGNDMYTSRLIELILKWEDKNIVIDADGLNALEHQLHLLEKRERKLIVTPHIGEMARLTGSLPKEILDNTTGVANTFSKKYNIITVLKSSRTIISNSNKIFVNIFGNAGMATAGSGDVLGGIIVSLLAQGNSLTLSSVLGVYIHSKAGDIAKESLGEHSLMARDIIEALPCVMKY